MPIVIFIRHSNRYILSQCNLVAIKLALMDCHVGAGLNLTALSERTHRFLVEFQ